jgi:formylglycine-generating enzyme required for sulfatase activity
MSPPRWTDPRVALGFLLGIAALALLDACSLISLDALTGGEGGNDAAGDAAGDGGGASDAPMMPAESATFDASDGGLPNEGGTLGCPSEMADLDGLFCIDKLEVTYGDYLVWAQTTGPVDAGPSCAWNTSYAPAAGCGGRADNADPVGGVNWCDAYAYCASRGKRLCGTRAGPEDGGAPVKWTFDDNTGATVFPAVDEWTYACTGGDAGLTFPYGQTFDASACNGPLPGGDGTVARVGSYRGCQGGFPGIFDMSGNAWEWENACDHNGGGSDPESDRCSLRGGSYDTLYAPGGQDLACAEDVYGDTRSSTGCAYGIRCCKDLGPP